MTERAPDLAVPIIGWRVWRIAIDGELVSAYTPAGWPSRAPIVARCYERPGAHAAPEEQCVCGVYACDVPAAGMHKCAQYEWTGGNQSTDDWQKQCDASGGNPGQKVVT